MMSGQERMLLGWIRWVLARTGSGGCWPAVEGAGRDQPGVPAHRCDTGGLSSRRTPTWRRPPTWHLPSTWRRRPVCPLRAALPPRIGSTGHAEDRAVLAGGCGHLGVPVRGDSGDPAARPDRTRATELGTAETGAAETGAAETGGAAHDDAAPLTAASPPWRARLAGAAGMAREASIIVGLFALW